MESGQITYKVRYQYTCDEGSELVTLPNGKQEKVKKLKKRTPTRRVQLEGEPKDLKKALLEALTESHHHDTITEMKILNVEEVGAKPGLPTNDPNVATNAEVGAVRSGVEKCCARIDELEKRVVSQAEAINALSESVDFLVEAKEDNAPKQESKPKSGK